MEDEFTFFAMLLANYEDVTLMDGTLGYYYSACISRDSINYFYIEASDVDREFKRDDIVQITGKIDGWLHWYDYEPEI